MRWSSSQAGLWKKFEHRPPPTMRPWEQHCLNRIGPADDVEAIVKAATERPLDRLYREHVAAKGGALVAEVETRQLRPARANALALHKESPPHQYRGL